MEELLARAAVLSMLAAESTRDLEPVGVEVVDVRLSRTELPQKAEEAIYAQMREQRRAIARDHRARGERQARELRAKAERKAEAEVARAQRDSEGMRGAGEAKAARTYASAYGRTRSSLLFFVVSRPTELACRKGPRWCCRPTMNFFGSWESCRTSKEGRPAGWIPRSLYRA